MWLYEALRSWNVLLTLVHTVHVSAILQQAFNYICVTLPGRPTAGRMAGRGRPCAARAWGTRPSLGGAQPPPATQSLPPSPAESPPAPPPAARTARGKTAAGADVWKSKLRSVHTEMSQRCHRKRCHIYNFQHSNNFSCLFCMKLIITWNESNTLQAVSISQLLQ